MLAVHPSKRNQSCTPHLLPAHIPHNGPINSSSTFFTPTTDPAGTHHAYLRGRHLHGTSLPLPSTHTGAVLQITDKLLASPVAAPPYNDDDNDYDGEEDGNIVEVKVAEQIGQFEEVIVWGHGGVVGEGDKFVRGLKEWIGFAEAMHGQDDGQDKDKDEQRGSRT
ncbi:hypothetical protein GRF29_154g620837 [Pseudopithomyces chartarum]|uniref:Uncharacterized protein n=1 Tax=Pseudopithomyces chartarum TaxID=1892770 RepID=A0AAN6LV58_9PLEO|nr:hypothetical protein GRF29_154g620837 [Pseudopithomyces chartarum]